ncbi:hypothetical protein [Pleionea sp. CnH1-48]|uniref:hypothetical protein n=1 Tax=Pleionea sp. CnH1-48 TaxID=2954494 RepID=UPI002096CC82|nr:hypothetical protein [Pleionea sp. CnH1-48]MCO7225603.1 hypothetical protein [Pleionea sp. CnH1-48]
MNKKLQNKLRTYQYTAIFSIFFALVGFSYNVWRLEITEENNNVRTACFEMLEELGELEQVVFFAHYDKDIIEGSPRHGWVRVGLINDLSVVSTPEIQQKASALKDVWQKNWESMVESRQAVDNITESIDELRSEIKKTLKTLS